MKKIIPLTLALLLVTAQMANCDTTTVRADGTGDYPTIQAAINAASNGDTVIAAPGTYTGPGNRDIDFLGKAITVRSTDPNDPNIVATTIIDCNGTETDPHRGFYFHNGEDANSVLDGFTIINGYGPYERLDSGMLRSYAGAILCCNGSSPTISNCTMSGNLAEYYGGGIYCYDNSSPTINNCTISANSARYFGGGICCMRNSNPTINYCTITGNSARDGGGINCYNSSPMSGHCTITRNRGVNGGGIYCYRASPTITNCIISNNSASFGGGGMYNFGGSPILTNCTITGNSADGGGGIYCWDSNPTIINCTITSNASRWGGGAIYCKYSSPTITNCTITGNMSRHYGGAMYYFHSNLTLTNCTVTGNSNITSHSLYGSGAIQSWESNSTITNCILWFNSTSYNGPEIRLNRHSRLTISYGNVRRGMAGVARYGASSLNWGPGNINSDPRFVEPGYWDMNDVWVEGNYHLLRTSPCIDAGDNTAVPADTTDLDGDGNTTEPTPFDLDGNPRLMDGNNDGNSVVDMGAYEAVVSCFGVNHVKLETKAGKKGNEVDIKGTFSPALPINFAVDDVAYIIDDGQGNAMVFLIPAGSFEVDGKPGKQKFKFDSPKGSQPDIKARFDFDKCKFELKAKRVQGTDEITSTTLTIELWAGANLAQEQVEVEVKPKHTEYKREPKLDCCPKCKGIALLEVTSTDPFTGDEYVLLFEPEPGKEKLKRKTVVDDGVNGRVKIDTSCSKPIEVGDVFGVYTVTDLIKIFGDCPDDENDE